MVLQDLLGPFSETLNSTEKKWFAETIEKNGRRQSCGLCDIDQLMDCIRNLWMDYLKRIRGNLPNDNAGEALELRMRLTETIAELWLLDVKKDLANKIRELIEKGY